MGTCQSITAQSHHRRGSNPHKTLLDKTNHTDSVHISEELKKDTDEPTTHPILLEFERFQKTSTSPGFGRVLDAGTGWSSMDWLRHLVTNKEEFGVTGWTAVTACESMAKDLKGYAEAHGMNDINKKNASTSDDNNVDGVIFGNWFETQTDGCEIEASNSAALLEGELYDTILVDYLIGAIDGYTPYLQDCIFDRLKKHLKPGGKMYLASLEPIPEKEPGPADILCQTKRIRDTCILLSGDRCYREYPLNWILRSMKRSSLSILEHKRFPIRHSMNDISAQLHVAKQKIPRIAAKTGNEGLACMIRESIAMLEHKAKAVTRSLPGQCITQGFDYLVVAKMPPRAEMNGRGVEQ